MFTKEYNGHKYTIYTTNNEKTVFAIASFAGKSVRGVAKCDPEDTPDIEKGAEIAILRCDLKITLKKIARGIKKIEAAEAEIARANEKYAKALKYLEDAEKSLEDIVNKLDEYKKPE